MVTNVELAKDMVEQKDKNRILEESLEELFEEAKNKDEEIGSSEKQKAKVNEEDIIPEPYPPLNEEPFLKAIKALGEKLIEGIPFFNGKMYMNIVMEWIEGMENNFECEGIIETEKVKVEKSRLRGHTLTWWCRHSKMVHVYGLFSFSY